MNNSKTVKVETPSDREVVVIREFDAPRQMLWQAITKPDLIKRWLIGPGNVTLSTCENDLTEGGAYRWVWKAENGEEATLAGTYREVKPLDRIVRTEVFTLGDFTGQEQLGTIDFINQGETTKIVITVLFASKEIRDATIQSGMAQGMEVGYRQLDKLLADSSIEA